MMSCHEATSFESSPSPRLVWLQVMRVETSPGVVEMCQLNQVEQVASEESARLAAMHHLGPIHTFLFSHTGHLLMANKRGRERYMHLSQLLTPLTPLCPLACSPAHLQCALLAWAVHTHARMPYTYTCAC